MVNKPLLSFACMLAACSNDPQQDPVIVKVPVEVHAVAPGSLTTPITDPNPIFVAPSDPRASSALTQDGERQLKVLLTDLKAHIAAWEAWAAQGTKQ